MAITPDIAVKVSANVCSFDLAQALTVETCSNPDAANLLLQDGWILIHVNSGDGEPLFILADPSDDWKPFDG